MAIVSGTERSGGGAIAGGWSGRQWCYVYLTIGVKYDFCSHLWFKYTFVDENTFQLVDVTVAMSLEVSDGDVGFSVKRASLREIQCFNEGRNEALYVINTQYYGRR